MKKICFITTISLTLKMFVLDLAKYLYETGEFDITFLCSHDDSFKNDLPDYIRFIPIKMERGISLGGIKACISMHKIFKKEKFDIVQYSTPNASLYASIAARMCNVPVRLYCQWGIVYVGFSGLKRNIFKLIEKTVCNLSTWVEPDSFGNLKFSHSEGLYSLNKGSVVWNGSANGVDLDKFDINNKGEWRNEIRAKHSIDSDTFVVGFVGRLTRDKGLNELLEALKNIQDIYSNNKLFIIGGHDNPEKINESLLDWANANPNIIFTGRTSIVEKYMAAMDVFVLPSYREGFGSVVIEAEAMGLPVIVTDIPGPTDAMVKNETGIVVKKGDADSLAEGILHLYNNEIIKNEMGKKARIFVEESFDRKILFQKIYEDRQDLLNR